MAETLADRCSSRAIRKRWPFIKHLFADGACGRTALINKAAFHDFIVEVIRRIGQEPGFSVVPRRWVVERSFAWTGLSDIRQVVEGLTLPNGRGSSWEETPTGRVCGALR